MRCCRVRDGQTIVYTRSTIDAPTEIFRVSAKDGVLAQLTRTNPGLAAFNLRKAESVWYEGAGGTKIQAWVVKPPDFVEGKKYPLLYLVHGGPQGAWHDGWTFRWNAAGVRGGRLRRVHAEPARLVPASASSSPTRSAATGPGRCTTT